MTFWLDAHLDPDLAPWLGARFKVIAKTVRELGLRDAKDEILFDAGRRFSEIVIVTKDEDLGARVLRLGSPPQILWLRYRNMSTMKMCSLLSMTFPGALRLLQAGARLVEITESRNCNAS